MNKYDMYMSNSDYIEDDMYWELMYDAHELTEKELPNITPCDRHYFEWAFDELCIRITNIVEMLPERITGNIRPDAHDIISEFRNTMEYYASITEHTEALRGFKIACEFGDFLLLRLF